MKQLFQAQSISGFYNTIDCFVSLVKIMPEFYCLTTQVFFFFFFFFFLFLQLKHKPYELFLFLRFQLNKRQFLLSVLDSLEAVTTDYLQFFSFVEIHVFTDTMFFFFLN